MPSTFAFDDIAFVKAAIKQLEWQISVRADESIATMQLRESLSQFLLAPAANVAQALDLLISSREGASDPNLLSALVRLSCESDLHATREAVSEILEEHAFLPELSDTSYMTSVERGYRDNLAYVCSRLGHYGIEYDA